MIDDLAATFLNCVTSLRLLFLRLQRGCKPCWTGVYMLRMAREKTTLQVCTFDESILLYQVKFMHLIFSNVWLCDVIGPKCYLIKCSS